jgi:glycosyltransferase involved in cell wall biosynthesis/2-polyprenyl-3-methyl-5-hydroxy-6-metoxy-1,4-benzoquinol methylase
MHIACTICACNYVAYARVLAESFHAHHPDGTFVVLLIDDEQGRLTPGEERIVWRRLRDIGLDDVEMRRLASIYDVRELSTAVKPLLLRHLLDAGAGAVIYLDPDIRVYGSLAPVWELAARHGIVLTPHTTEPFPRDGSPVDSFYILAAGVYNLGFAGVGPSARPFLDWWWQATRREALNDVSKMMFTDQRWIDFVPCLFEPWILKDPGYNVAYWNLHARTLTLDGDRVAVNGEPLRFFHFSGYDVDKPWLLSRHQGDRPRVLLSDRPVLSRLCSDYREALQQAGISAGALERYGWGTLACGLEFTEGMRRLYRGALLAAEQGRGPEPPDPFDDAQPGAFVAWLNSPDPAGPQRVSRYLYHLFLSRIDLQMHFHDVYGADAGRYLDWVRQDGVVQAYIPPELLPERRAPEGSTRDEPPALEEGLNIAGYFRAELGIGEAARLLVSAVEAARIPYSTITTDTGALSRQAHAFTSHPEGVAAYDVNLLCVNADVTPRFVRDMGPEFREGRYTIGYWFWEVERFPPRQHAAFDAVDEVWAATDFVADAVRRASPRPVFTIPVPLAGARQPPPPGARERLGLPDRFLFLFSFDFLSVFERKNPLALVQAFARAFEPGSGPTLLIKTINGHIRLTDLERLRAEIGDRPDIRLVDGYYAAADRDALAGLCDCYVSLHRSEGLGLTMAEAMAAGKPVIATGYSGNMHFMTAENSYPVDYVLTPVPANCEPYPVDAMWADPDPGHAARLMRRVYEQPDEAAARGRRARADILQRHGVEASAAAIARRLETIRRDRRSRTVVPPPLAVNSTPPAPGTAAAPEATTALEAALARLEALAAPRVTVEGRRFPSARTVAQRGLFRLLRPFWFQHQQLHSELVGVLQQLGRGLQQEREARVATERRLVQLTADFASASREIGRVETRFGQTLKERTLHVNGELQDIGARLKRANEVSAGMIERLARLDALGARVDELAAAGAELRAASAHLQADTSTQLAALTSLGLEIASVRAASSQGRKDLAGRVEALAQTATDLGARVAALARAAAETSAAIASLAATDAALASTDAALATTDGALDSRVGDVDRRVAALEPEIASLRAGSESWFTSAAAHLEELTRVVGTTEQSLSTLEHRLFAVPYMADPDRFLDRDEQGRERLGYGSANGAGEKAFYVGFEDLFRGPQTLIRSRQAVYVPLLRQASHVVDIGCGRGEMLDLLAAAGTPATGVDIDPGMVAVCRAKGHRVEQVDAVQFLCARDERSLPAIFSAQVIEHMAFEQLKAFLTLCRSRLRPGGTMILETVNPHALEAFKTFYTDLTHQRPIFPEVALALIGLAGFARAHVVFPLGTGSLTENRRTQGEYAVVAAVEDGD